MAQARIGEPNHKDETFVRPFAFFVEDVRIFLIFFNLSVI